MIEEWKDIKNYPDYMVSNQGRVISLNFKRTGKEQVLRCCKGKDGYLAVKLYKNGKLKNFKVHRLVSEAFIPNTDNKPFIDHINTDKTDNRVENLRWVTSKENSNNPLTKKHFSESRKGKLNYNSKKVLQFDLNGNLIRSWDAVREVERELGYYNSSISSCCNGKRKTTNGYIWRYYDLELYLESKLFKAFNIKNKLVA